MNENRDVFTAFNLKFTKISGLIKRLLKFIGIHVYMENCNKINVNERVHQ